jgi:hypothetical protein
VLRVLPLGSEGLMRRGREGNGSGNGTKSVGSSEFMHLRQQQPCRRLNVVVRARSTQMPKFWLPPPDMKKLPNPAPWTAAEAKDAEYAIRTGLDEMIGYFERKPSAVLSLWGDSIEALMQVTYASANDRAFDAKVRDASRKNLTMLINQHLKRKPKAKFVTCDDFERLLPLAIFAHRLYPRKDPRTV